SPRSRHCSRISARTCSSASLEPLRFVPESTHPKTRLYYQIVLRACLKLSGSEHAVEAHAGHEQRGEDGRVPRGLVAHLVVDAQAAVALQAAERLLDLPAPRLDDEALAADRADELLDHAVAGEPLAAALRGDAEVHPGE